MMIWFEYMPSRHRLQLFKFSLASSPEIVSRFHELNSHTKLTKLFLESCKLMSFLRDDS